MATMKLRSFAAIWHPLAAQLGPSPPIRLGERRLSSPTAAPIPTARSLLPPQQHSPQPAARNCIKESHSRKPASSGPQATGAGIGVAALSGSQRLLPHRPPTGSGLGCLPRDNSPDSMLPERLLFGDHAAALEQVPKLLLHICTRNHGLGCCLRVLSERSWLSAYRSRFQAAIPGFCLLAVLLPPVP